MVYPASKPTAVWASAVASGARSCAEAVRIRHVDKGTSWALRGRAGWITLW